jgi:hypothetical protein
MPQNKKLQVFISSTYKDLKEERQAAVEAILQAKHIPVGMELFAAGNESKMDVIRSWIDASDIYFLILGGRYGSIEGESGKSYVQLEYEYALDRRKPIFAVVIDEAYLRKKAERIEPGVIEIDHCENLRQFREVVETKVVRFWSDPRDIKTEVIQSLADFSSRDDIPGWIHGSEAKAMRAEMIRLSKENAELKERSRLLFREEALMEMEAAIPEGSAVWVITPDLFHVTHQTNMSSVVRQNAARGVVYTYIYPQGHNNTPYEPALVNLFSAHPTGLIRRSVKEARFSSLAITHYRILNPESIDGEPSSAYLELPTQPPGYWIEVESNGVKGLVDRFYNSAKGMK